MVFRQPMRSTELATAIRTLKRKKSFFPALLALHAHSAPFMLRDKLVVYTFLSDTAVFPSTYIFHSEFSQI
jgi:hypothetical protein